jgi:hypothetical protein
VGTPSAPAPVEPAISWGTAPPPIEKFTYWKPWGCGMSARPADIYCRLTDTSGEFSGTVVDAATHAPIPGAKVTFASMGLPQALGGLLSKVGDTTLSDANGQFSIRGLGHDMTYFLHVEAPGYGSLHSENLLIRSSDPVQLALGQ